MVVTGDHVNGDVAGIVVAFERIKYRQARLIGQNHVQNNGAGLEAFGQFDRFFGRAGDQNLKAEFARKVADNRGETGVVFHHQQDAA